MSQADPNRFRGMTREQLDALFGTSGDSAGYDDFQSARLRGLTGSRAEFEAMQSGRAPGRKAQMETYGRAPAQSSGSIADRFRQFGQQNGGDPSAVNDPCLLYTSPSPRDS